MTTKPRKTDRRTLYTIQVIKQALLQLINQENYAQLTVAKICRSAEITRTTFYLHFDNLTMLLNAVLDDALDFDQLPMSDQSYVPACQRVAKNEQYRAIFMDPSLSDYIIGRIYAHERDIMVPKIMQQAHVDQADADLLFRYTLRGSFDINYRHQWRQTAAWQHDVNLLNFFVEHGYQALHQR